MNKEKIKGANKRMGGLCLKLLLFYALFILLVITIKDARPLFIKLLFWYPTGIIGIWALLMNLRDGQGCQCNRKLDSLRALKITISHTVFLMIAISSFMLVNKVVSSWYVICDIFGMALERKVMETIRCLALFILIIIIVMVRSMLDYKKFGLEYFSVIVHGIGLVGTLACYINIIKSNNNLELYGHQIISCEGVYVESLILACVFLAFCSWVKEDDEGDYPIER